MKRYLTKIIVFLLPIALVLLLPSIVLRKAGENFKSIDELVASDQKYLIGYAYNESNYKYLKWYSLQVKERCDILVLGASRVLQFREEMFTSSFYNAGFSIRSMSDIVPFLETIPDGKKPKILILGIDQLMFNEAADDLAVSKGTDFWENSFNKYVNGAVLKNFYTDYFNGKLKYKDRNDGIVRVGFNALINERGYRPDGSLNYGNQIGYLLNDDPAANDYHFEQTKKKIEKGIGGFQFGDEINPKALVKLREILAYCKKQKIELLAFLPPIADEAYRQMSESGKFGYFEGIIDEIQEPFAEYNFEVYSYPNATSCGSNDSEMIDGLHGGELCYQRLLIDMAKRSRILQKVTDLQKLKTDLLQAENRYCVYKD